jgi:hypothetical protein
MIGKKKVILIMETIAAIIGVISAYGSTCLTLNPPTDPDSTFFIMNQLQWVWYITTFLSYVAGIGSGVLVWAIIKNKKWAYLTAIIMNVIGFVSGLTPTLLLNGKTPSFLRTFIYAIILILLFLPAFKKALTEDDEETGSVSANLSAVLILPGLILSLQTLIVAPTHIIDSVNVYMYNSLQLIGGLVLTAIGVFIFAIGRYRKKEE